MLLKKMCWILFFYGSSEPIDRPPTPAETKGEPVISWMSTNDLKQLLREDSMRSRGAQTTLRLCFSELLKQSHYQHQGNRIKRSLF